MGTGKYRCDSSYSEVNDHSGVREVEVLSKGVDGAGR